jgi:hypothetical protein
MKTIQTKAHLIKECEELRKDNTMIIEALSKIESDLEKADEDVSLLIKFITEIRNAVNDSGEHNRETFIEYLKELYAKAYPKI